MLDSVTFVFPAQAGIQKALRIRGSLDPCLRRGDVFFCFCNTLPFGAGQTERTSETKPGIPFPNLSASLVGAGMRQNLHTIHWMIRSRSADKIVENGFEIISQWNMINESDVVIWLQNPRMLQRKILNAKENIVQPVALFRKK
jgi:hypothetical protein